MAKAEADRVPPSFWLLLSTVASERTNGRLDTERTPLQKLKQKQRRQVEARSSPLAGLCFLSKQATTSLAAGVDRETNEVQVVMFSLSLSLSFHCCSPNYSLWRLEQEEGAPGIAVSEGNRLPKPEVVDRETSQGDWKTPGKTRTSTN